MGARNVLVYGKGSLGCLVTPRQPTRSRESTGRNQMQILPSRHTLSNLFLLARSQFQRF